MIKLLIAIIFFIPFHAEAIKCSHSHSFVLKCEGDKCTKAFLYQSFNEGPCPKSDPSKNNFEIFPLNMQLPFEDLKTDGPVGLFGFYCMNANPDPESAYLINDQGEMTLICPKGIWKGLTPINSKAVTIEELREEFIKKDKEDERNYWISKLTLPIAVILCVMIGLIWILKPRFLFKRTK